MAEQVKYKQKIRIGKNVTNIMKLPCVFSCHKEADGNLCYLLYDWDEYGNYVEARQGDWLYEGHDGRWRVKRESKKITKAHVREENKRQGIEESLGEKGEGRT